MTTRDATADEGIVFLRFQLRVIFQKTFVFEYYNSLFTWGYTFIANFWSAVYGLCFPRNEVGRDNEQWRNTRKEAE